MDLLSSLLHLLFLISSVPQCPRTWAHNDVEAYSRPSSRFPALEPYPQEYTGAHQFLCVSHLRSFIIFVLLYNMRYPQPALGKSEVDSSSPLSVDAPNESKLSSLLLVFMCSGEWLAAASFAA